MAFCADDNTIHTCGKGKNTRKVKFKGNNPDTIDPEEWYDHPHFKKLTKKLDNIKWK